MDDDRLASELERRASGASPRPDWASRDLLPAVWREIDARPQPVLVSRWSPLAGLATLVVALLVLAVAVPRLAPQPPSATSSPATTSTPGNPVVLSTADFAARLATGNLDGQTVLVDGAIATSAGPAQPTPSCAMPTGCYMGDLWDTDPPISVAAPLTRTTDRVHATYVESGVAPDGWMFWRAARPAIQGTLLLAVANDGSVQFLGIPRAGQAGPIWSVADAAALDINSLGPDEVVLVDGWLGGFTVTRCLAGPSPLVVEGLPNRKCTDEWIAGVPYPGQPSVQVQPGAYSEFAPNPTTQGDRVPRKAVYAVAPRLEGWCATGDPPCWQWNVVARVDQGASEAPSPSPTPETAASPGPMSVTEFAAQLAAGALDGKTVLVSGRIDPELRYGPICLAIEQPCFMGVLSGADPPVDVSWRWVPSTAAQANRTYDYTRTGWQSWYQAPAPVEGVLVLSVTGAGQVDFVGRVHSPLHTLAWSVAGANELDINSLSPEQVVLVEGWLVDTEPPGSEVNIDCVPRQFPDLDGLPSRYCQPTDYLSSEQPTEGRAPDSAAALTVQRAAAKQFGGRDATQPATYAIAPRLYGGGCSGAPPCWLWDVVARVDANPAAPPTPTPSPTAAAASLHDCGSKPNAFDPSLTFVADASGAVRSCTTELGMPGGWPAGDASVIVQPVRDATNEIEVAWATDRCRPERIVIEVKPAGSSLAVRVIVDRSGVDGYECVDVGSRPPRRADLTLTEPINPADVSAELVIVPDLHADLPRTFDCTAPAPAVEGLLTPSSVPRIVDHTGVVTGCSQLEAGAPAVRAVGITNLNGFDSARFDWVDTTCDGPIEADFQAVTGGYRLAVKQPSEPCQTGGPIAVVVDYRIPMPSQLVAADYQGPPPVFACADTPYVAVVDEAGVVRSCAASETAASPAEGDLLIDNPGGDTAALQLSWVGSSCGYELHLVKRGDEYAALVYYSTCGSAGVIHTLTIQLTMPIRADQITEWSIGGPPRATPSPTPSQPVQPRGVRTIDCPDETTGAGPVQIEDHTGLVIGCSAGGAVSGDEPAVTSSLPSELTVRWMAPCVVDPLNTRIELWYREPKGDPSDPSRFQPPYLLVVNRTHPTEPYACLDAGSGRQARIQLERWISAADVELFFTQDGRGTDSAQAGDGVSRFQLEIAADKPEYTVGESIAVTGSLLSETDTTVTGWVHPIFGLEQLDGVIRFDWGPIIMSCPRPIDLTGGVPLEESTPWPTSWSPDDPQASFLDAYVRDGELILPAGTYRFYAFSRFSIGDTCAGDRVELEGSIVVTVR